MAVGDKSPFHSLTRIFGEQTAQACANAWLRQLSRLDAPGDAKEKPPRHRAADVVPSWVILFPSF